MTVVEYRVEFQFGGLANWLVDSTWNDYDSAVIAALECRDNGHPTRIIRSYVTEEVRNVF